MNRKMAELHTELVTLVQLLVLALVRMGKSNNQQVATVLPRKVLEQSRQNLSNKEIGLPEIENNEYGKALLQY